MITRRTGFAEVLGRSSFSVTAVVTDAFVGDQPRQRDDPAGSMTNGLKVNKIFIKNVSLIEHRDIVPAA